MNSGTSILLDRDCEAVQIPAGNTVVLPAGTAVSVTQSLSGSFTVRALDGLFHIATRNAAALGPEARAQATSWAARTAGAGGPLDEKAIWEALRECFDPEIPVNIVDLGLVYDVGLDSLTSGGHEVAVKMTLTAPGCGMAPVIARDVKERILALPDVREARVDLVWDPPWHQSMMTPAARLTLGLD